MKRKNITRQLVKHLEKHTMSFTQIQQLAWKISKGIPLKQKIEVSRGYWCGGITKLFNSNTIGKHPKYGYFALPGTSKNKVMFTRESDPWSFRRNKNELHLQVLKHPKIKKLIEKDGTIHHYI
jgi:hypothetical protein